MSTQAVSGRILSVVADPKATRADVAEVYAEALTHPGRFDWTFLNGVILSRWSRSGLSWIKDEAWKQASSAGRSSRGEALTPDWERG